MSTEHNPDELPRDTAAAGAAEPAEPGDAASAADHFGAVVPSPAPTPTPTDAIGATTPLSVPPVPHAAGFPETSAYIPQAPSAPVPPHSAQAQPQPTPQPTPPGAQQPLQAQQRQAKPSPRTGPIVWGALILVFCAYVAVQATGGSVDPIAWLITTILGLGVLLLGVGVAVLVRSSRERR
ncbi:hypothetical protein ACI1US_01060 [Leucobacter sp. BZR 635]